MWDSVVPCFISLVIVAFTHYVYRWRNPKCNGILPPGSMGFPLIGETIQFFASNNSLDVPYLFKKRFARYGTMFRTSLAGHPIVVSSDPDFNYFIFQQERKSVELWYMDSFSATFGGGLEYATDAQIHKYFRNAVLNHFGTEALKENLLPKIERMSNQALESCPRRYEREDFLTDEFVIYLIFGLLLASFATISAIVTLAMTFLTDHPLVVKELLEEQEAILKNRENVDSPLTWKELKSLSYISQIITEILRMSSTAPGILRNVIKDIDINGYVIPKGWTIMVNCVGEEFSKTLIGIFLHVLVTKFT
ncbi:hypothetical protein MKX01_034436 [Papaver californicum]|nr:hypothetical protein MKX01_034436 [Papaver californicum]